jgi:hypothetical protein
MIIVKLYGGLGNQMFQYATAKRLAHQNNSELKLDISHYDNLVLPNGLPYRSFDLPIFNIKESIATTDEINLFKNNPNSFFKKIQRKIRNKIIPYTSIYEPHFHFFSELLYIKGNIYIDGYWQSEKYFKDIEDVIRKNFELEVTLTAEGLELLNKIKSTNAICLNIRRQEFASNVHVDQFIGLEYIDKAIQMILKKVDQPHFFIFSDELSWCKQHLKTNESYTFVEEHLYGEKFKDCLFFMTSCKHYIIPNSTFGWWAAWLNARPDKIVIAPDKWLKDKSKDTKDLLPESWIRL